MKKKKKSLSHFGIKDMHWGERRYQNPDGTLTEAGKLRYGRDSGSSEPRQRSLQEQFERDQMARSFASQRSGEPRQRSLQEQFERDQMARSFASQRSGMSIVGNIGRAMSSFDPVTDGAVGRATQEEHRRRSEYDRRQSEDYDTRKREEEHRLKTDPRYADFRKKSEEDYQRRQEEDMLERMRRKNRYQIGAGYRLGDWWPD